jgi:ubiquinone biosynthesis protein COQ9
MSGADAEQGADAALRERLLEATLAHVTFDGWSEVALEAGAHDLGVDPAAAHRVFARGAIDLVVAFSGWADRKMEADLAARELGALKVRERIAAAVRARLEVCAEHREAVRLAIGLLALPIHAPDATRCLYRTVDAMWHAVGDRSTDFNFYTKRALLAGVQLSTTLYWLQDNSENAEASWEFLGRRIDDVLKIQTVRGRLEKLGARPPSLLRLLRQFAEKGRRPAA